MSHFMWDGPMSKQLKSVLWFYFCQILGQIMTTKTTSLPGLLPAGVTPTGTVVAGILRYYCQHGSGTASTRYISKILERSPRQIRTILNQLSSKKLITWHQIEWGPDEFTWNEPLYQEIWQNQKRTHGLSREANLPLNLWHSLTPSEALLWADLNAQAERTSSEYRISITRNKLAKRYNVAQRTITRWLQSLEEKGLIDRVLDGEQYIYLLEPEEIEQKESSQGAVDNQVDPGDIDSRGRGDNQPSARETFVANINISEGSNNLRDPNGWAAPTVDRQAAHELPCSSQQDHTLSKAALEMIQQAQKHVQQDLGLDPQGSSGSDDVATPSDNLPAKQVFSSRNDDRAPKAESVPEICPETIDSGHPTETLSKNMGQELRTHDMIRTPISNRERGLCHEFSPTAGYQHPSKIPKTRNWKLNLRDSLSEQTGSSKSTSAVQWLQNNARGSSGLWTDLSKRTSWL